MKHLTFKLAVFIASMWTVPSQAQTFIKDDPFTSLPKLHRLSPAVADLNNDGRIDIYQGGVNWLDGMAWQNQSYVWINKGEGHYN